jgi:hypothetical protein
MTIDPTPPSFTVFDDGHRIASGSLAEVAVEMLRKGAGDGPRTALIFHDATGSVIDFDLAGSRSEIEARAERREAALQHSRDPHGPGRGPGRPRLGVVSREVTLLPRHWAWLSAQRGGASATLRRLVDDARRQNQAEDQIRAAQDTTYRFLSALAGDFRGYEEAIRALFRSDRAAFEASISTWPEDLRAYTLCLATSALGDPTSSPPPAEQG